jgi:hypothetical protein
MIPSHLLMVVMLVNPKLQVRHMLVNVSAAIRVDLDYPIPMVNVNAMSNFWLEMIVTVEMEVEVLM